MPDERIVKKDLRKRKRGQKIFADDYNAIATALNAPEKPKFTGLGGVPLFATAHAAIPVHSVFGIDNTMGTGTADETPVVKTKVADDDTLRLFTNAQIPMVSAASSYIEVIGSTRIKVDVDASDAGFVVGEECGPDGSIQVKSTGTGLVCLSNPIVYETTKKYVWAIAKGGSAGGASIIEFIVTSATTVADTDSPYDGMRELTVTVVGPSCDIENTMGDENVLVYEHDPQCLTGDETDEALEGRKGWAYEGVFQDQSAAASPGDKTPCHKILFGICCPPEA